MRDSRAVVNAILDHKMHCTQMTDADALEFLTRRAFQSEGEARLKVIRAKQSSVQLSTYFVGRMVMYGLRQTVQRDLGDRFQLGRYHEAVLAPGPVPVKYLPEMVRKQLGLQTVASGFACRAAGQRRFKSLSQDVPGSGVGNIGPAAAPAAVASSPPVRAAPSGSSS